MAAFNTSTLLLSILMAIIPGGPGLSGTRMSPFRILLQLRMIEVMVTTGAIKRAKFQSNRHPPTYHHVCNVCKEYALQQKFSEVSVGLCEEMGSPNILYRPDALPVLSSNQQCQRTEGKKYHTRRTCSTQAYQGSSIKAPGYLRGVAKRLVSPLTPVPHP